MAERRVMLVMVGGRGIGVAVARLAAGRGYDVCLTYLGDAARAEETADFARGAGARTLALRADVADPGARERCFAALDAEWGGHRRAGHEPAHGGGAVRAPHRRATQHGALPRQRAGRGGTCSRAT